MNNGERLAKNHTPSRAWLKENVGYAYLDELLWILLQNKVWRMQLRDYIIEHKLMDDFWSRFCHFWATNFECSG